MTFILTHFFTTVIMRTDIIYSKSGLQILPCMLETRKVIPQNAYMKLQVLLILNV